MKKLLTMIGAAVAVSAIALTGLPAMGLTLNDGLVAYLPFDDGTVSNAVAVSPVVPEASTATAPTFVDNGMVGKCLNIPSGAYVKLTGSDTGSLTFEDSNKSFTAVIWANYGTQSGDPLIFANKGGTGVNRGVLLCAQNNTANAHFNAGTGRSGAVQTQGQDKFDKYFTGEGSGKWTFYAMTYNDGTFTMYQGKSDGTLSTEIGSLSKTGYSLATGYPFVLAQLGSCDYGSKFVGQLDDFALWTRALSHDDIWRIYEYGRSGMELGDVLNAQTVKWNGSAGDGKMSNGENWDGGSAPAAGDTLDFSAVAAGATIIADIPNTTFDTITFGSNKFSVSGDLNLTTITRPYLMSVNSGATVTVGYVASDRKENYFIDRLDGTFIVTGQFNYNDSKDYGSTARYIYKSGSGTVVASQFRVGFSSNDCYVNANNNHLVLGAGGLAIRKKYFLKLNNQTFTLGASADFTLGRREDFTASQSTFDGTGTLYIDTTDFFDSTIGRTITIEGYLSGGTRIEARGKGTVVFDTIPEAANAFNMGLNATDGVTIELKTGAQVSNGGATTFADGTTLKLPAAGSGAVTLKGPLAFSGTGAVNLKLGTGTEEVMKGEYELLTGVTSFPADFSNVVLINPIPDGTAATYVTDGTTLKLLVYRPKGLVIFVM